MKQLQIRFTPACWKIFMFSYCSKSQTANLKTKIMIVGPPITLKNSSICL